MHAVSSVHFRQIRATSVVHNRNGNGSNGSNGSSSGGGDMEPSSHFAGTIVGLPEAPIRNVEFLGVDVGSGGTWRCVHTQELRIEGNVTPAFHATGTCKEGP